jgi:hypothetical protein
VLRPSVVDETSRSTDGKGTSGSRSSWFWFVFDGAEDGMDFGVADVVRLRIGETGLASE